jgi:hypothetical protein
MGGPRPRTLRTLRDRVVPLRSVWVTKPRLLPTDPLTKRKKGRGGPTQAAAARCRAAVDLARPLSAGRRRAHVNGLSASELSAAADDASSGRTLEHALEAAARIDRKDPGWGYWSPHAQLSGRWQGMSIDERAAWYDRADGPRSSFQPRPIPITGISRHVIPAPPVRSECRGWALARGEQGIWGGVDEHGRVRLRQAWRRDQQNTDGPMSRARPRTLC